MKPVIGNQHRENIEIGAEETLFHIDFSWWALREDEYNTYFHSLLCENHQNEFN